MVQKTYKKKSKIVLISIIIIILLVITLTVFAFVSQSTQTSCIKPTPGKSTPDICMKITSNNIFLSWIPSLFNIKQSVLFSQTDINAGDTITFTESRNLLGIGSISNSTDKCCVTGLSIDYYLNGNKNITVPLSLNTPICGSTSTLSVLSNTSLIYAGTWTSITNYIVQKCDVNKSNCVTGCNDLNSTESSNYVIVSGVYTPPCSQDTYLICNNVTTNITQFQCINGTSTLVTPLAVCPLVNNTNTTCVNETLSCLSCDNSTQIINQTCVNNVLTPLACPIACPPPNQTSYITCYSASAIVPQSFLGVSNCTAYTINSSVCDAQKGLYPDNDTCIKNSQINWVLYGIIAGSVLLIIIIIIVIIAKRKKHK